MRRSVMAQTKGQELLSFALDYFYRHCPDTPAYMDDWTEKDFDDAYDEAQEIISEDRG